MLDQRSSTGLGRWHLRLFDDRGSLGMGVLLGGEFVLSCAHVVGERDEVRVAFSFGEPGNFRARPTGFAGSAEDGSRDLALLRLVEPFPTSWSAPLAAPAELPPRARVRCHGHSGNYPDGMWINLRVDGPAGPGGRLVQLSTSSFCRNVERGFSGAAVLDGQSGAVLGIVVQKAADQHAQGVAWMIPVSTILDRLPELRSSVAESPPVRSRSVRFGQLAAQISELRDAEDEVARLRWLLFRDASTATFPQRNYNASRIALAGFRGREEEKPGSVPVEELDVFERELADALDLVVAERRRLEEIGARSPEPVPVGTPCRRLDCRGQGSIDETGYCDTCSRRPAAEGPVPDGNETWDCAGIVPLPVLRFPAETGEIPGTPRLRPGSRVGAKNYEIRRFLAKGGFGRIYLAHDPGLRRKVALKASIDHDEQAARILRAEAWHLSRLTHDNLLSAHDFFRHPVDGEPVDFIAMDYVEGVALTELAKLPRGPRDSPLLAEILAYGCEILAAIEYLHRQGLHYTDMKPANVMRSSRGIVIVDLAGVWDPRREDEKPQLTRTFYPEEEFRTAGRPSVGTDLYAVARTLTELIRPLTRSADQPGLDSAQRVLDRALGLDTSRRFPSAAEMADQLRRVVREIMALHGFEQPLDPSHHFEPVTSDLDHGLGVVPPLESWWRSGAELVGFGLPSPQKIARELPAPRVDPRDRNAANLSRVTGSDFRRLTTMLQDSVESRLKACRMALAQGDRPDVAGARESLDAAQAQRHRDEAQGKQTPGPAWRLDWHEGLVALAAGEIDTALRHFTEVRAILPGEAIPKVALGLCHEHLGESTTGAETAFDVARSCYLAVWQRDRAPAGAAFGLARLFLRAGDRAAAAKVLDEVPAVSRQYDAARIAAIRVHLLWLGGADWPSVSDVRTAARRADEVLRADSELRRYDADTRDRLVAWLQRSALALAERSGGTVRFPTQAERHEKELFGDPLTEHGIRQRLERSLEALARQARRRGPAELSALLDRKNELRPMTWW